MIGLESKESNLCATLEYVRSINVPVAALPPLALISVNIDKAGRRSVPWEAQGQWGSTLLACPPHSIQSTPSGGALPKTDGSAQVNLVTALDTDLQWGNLNVRDTVDAVLGS